MNKILITGATGFIGSALVERLKSEYRVICHSKTVDNSPSNGDFFQLDINGNSNWKKYLNNVDTIIHLAAVAHNKSNDNNYINEVNVDGTINLASQAAQCGVKRFIFISSIGVLGNSTSTPFSELSVPAPHSQYAESKLLAENTLLKIAQESHLEVVIIRPVLVYGVGAPGNFAKLVNLVSKVPVLPFGLCNNQRSFLSVNNLVDFISICITHPNAKNETFCISDGVDVSIREFTDAIATGLDKKLIQLPISLPVIKLFASMVGKSELIEQLIGDLTVDISKAVQLLGWQASCSMPEVLSHLVKNK